MLPKHFVLAIYQDTGVRQYNGNPFIEALPPILSVEQAGSSLKGKAQFEESDRIVSGKARMHMVVSLLDDYFQPLSQHVQLEERIGMMIRRGYVGRNLNDGTLNKRLQQGYELIKTGGNNTANFAVEKTTARSMSLIGISGSGKSKSLERVLETYPQVIYHEATNFIQLTYLKIECPSNGDLESLCLNFFSAVDAILDTNYEQRYAKQRLSVPKMLALMRQTATHRAIGVLVIDEIQRLSQVRSGGKEQMLEFFVELVNQVGVPVVLVGTPKARPIFELELQSGRRSAGIGSIYWETIPQKITTQDGVKDHPNWQKFTRDLWKYQWLIHGNDPLTDEIRDCWYDLSQGVLDIVVKLFVLAQLRAIASKKERITVSVLKSVYEQELKPVHPMLAALRSGNPELIVKYSDLRIVDIEKRLLELGGIILSSEQKDELQLFGGNQEALRVFNLMRQLDDDYDPELLIPLVKRIFKEQPDLKAVKMLPLLAEWYSEQQENPPKQQKPKVVKVSRKEWQSLKSDDLRYLYSESGGSEIYQALQQRGLMFELEDWAVGI
ncbi:AAA family ATPase [Methylomonas methanica]|uniref:Transposon Tn7 transposition protein TnsC n=1 Tax=Methylomonas methanica (strain DSM 25384 / MC09) TaxID=857087 RepID=G0A4U3_METMM|nr:AAA family ATPase [Methylomonas methanica]AEG02834.1 transposon Tn7 transposition protein TnsC [Methylomonas methanica MC09]